MYSIKSVFIFLICFLSLNSAFSQLTLTASTTNPKCNGGTDGSVVATASGGTAPYQYQLSEAGAGGWQSSNSFTGLAAGTYPISVIDANNNYKTIYVTLNNPTGITATVVSNSASCQSSYDATVTASPSGGSAPYNYAWKLNGTLITSSNASSNHITGYNTATVTGPSGSYAVAITDQNGCSGAVSYYNPTPIPLNANSFNQDVIVEANASSARAGVTSKLDNDQVGFVLFQTGFSNSNAGLPTNRVITSLQDNTLTYNLQSDTVKNSARTLTNGVSTINFTTPTALAKLYILGTSGNGQSTYSYQVNFSDGTSYPGNITNNTVSFRDWFASSGSDIAMNGLARVSLAGTVDKANFALFQSPITIPAQYYNKTISSVKFTNTSTAGSAGNIFAITGYQASGTASNVGYATANVSQPSVTITSNLDSSTNYYCANQTITYNASTVHGGATPTYKWEYSTDNSNWATATSTSNTYTANAPDSSNYYVRVTANASSDVSCLNSTTSQTVVFSATRNTVTPTITISGPNSTCQGSNTTYNITNTTNGGSSPNYQWFVDDNVNTSMGTGTTASINSLSTGTHNIKASMKSSIGCATSNPATSSAISTIVNISVTPSVSINNINGNLPITFQIATSNGLGSSPSYQWYLNGSSISGATSSSYTTPNNASGGDSYSLKVISNATCASPTTVMSNYRTIAMALPISLKSFEVTAYPNKVSLDWKTATEINTDRFEIWRKYQDSADYKIIGYVKAMNFASGSSYQLMDYPKKAGTYQYFLKNYDFDGRYQTSNIQSVYYNLQNGISENKIFPNPFKDKIIVSYVGDQTEDASVVIYNLQGAIVKSKAIQIINGNQQIELNNLTNIPSGVYFIKIINSNHKILFSSKLLK